MKDVTKLMLGRWKDTINLLYNDQALAFTQPGILPGDISVKKIANGADKVTYYACSATMAFTSFATWVSLATPSSDNTS